METKWTIDAVRDFERLTGPAEHYTMGWLPPRPPFGLVRMVAVDPVDVEMAKMNAKMEELVIKFSKLSLK